MRPSIKQWWTASRKVQDCSIWRTGCGSLHYCFLSPGSVGGADGRYTLAGTDDYRQDHPKGIQYMMQGIHTTLVHHYNDTLNFIIATEGSSNSSKTTVEVRSNALLVWCVLLLFQAFSISQIHGAWCDDGQNYKNLVGYVKGLSMWWCVVNDNFTDSFCRRTLWTKNHVWLHTLKLKNRRNHSLYY